MSRAALPSSSDTTETSPLPRKRIPAPVPLAADPSSPARTVRKLPRKNPTTPPLDDGKADAKETLPGGESNSSKPIRTYTPAPIQSDIRQLQAQDRKGVFSIRNALITVFSLFIGISFLALLLMLIGLSGILDRLPKSADITFQSAESFEIKALPPSPEMAATPASAFEASASRLPGLPSAPSTHVFEPSAIPVSVDTFTKLAAPDSLSHAPEVFVPDLFEPAPPEEKSEESSDQTSKEKPKETTKRTSNQTSGETSEKTPGETTKRASNQTSDQSGSSSPAKSHYGISELDGSPRLLRHGSTTFPSSLASQGVSRGTVVFEVELSTSGSVSVRRVVSSTHPDFVAAARRVASGARFTPPKCNGQAVKAIMRWPIIIEK